MTAAASSEAEPMEEDHNVPKNIVANGNNSETENGKKPAAVKVKKENAQEKAII